jgi:sulfane dehydrogenase subunit SoxC
VAKFSDQESDSWASAGNGLLSRRQWLQLGAGGAAASMVAPVWAAGGARVEPWRSGSGAPPSSYGDQPSLASLKREQISVHPLGTQAGASSTPLQLLNGTITPNSLHFERHHSGIPEIDPSAHRLTIHGLVRRPLSFDYEALLRYPMISRVLFMECSGNSYRNTLDTVLDETAGGLNGLISCAEWTGIPLHYLLDEAGLDASATWVVAEGADAAGMNRSVPLSLATSDAMLALYQNGEPLRRSQGFPMRLLVPGCEGNLSVKWLRSLKVMNQPAHTREETSKYTDLQLDGKAWQFSLRMGVKSVITSPSGQMQLPEKGVFEITGLAWTGHGSVRRVEVSADGGRSWTDAAIQSEIGEHKPVRFRIPWRWNGQPAVLQSRAVDSVGNVQPTRSQALQNVAPGFSYHYNGIQSWLVDASGRVSNVHG